MADAADEFRWQGFFQRARDPLFVLNRRGRLLFVNHAWETLTGLSAVEVRGLARRHDLGLLASNVPSLNRVAEQVRLASQTRVPVLLTGERGTGKQWLARAIHFQSALREKNFVALDCKALPADALAAVLFGD